jgi:hypothetical protein
MLNGLGNECDLVIMTMGSSGTKILGDFIMSVLIQHDTKHSTKEDDPQDKALIANCKGKKLFNPASVMCKKKGHKSY